jgi:vancomycin resistance protein VanW
MTRVRRALRQHVPKRWRRYVAQIRRRLNDWRTRNDREFSDERVEPDVFTKFVCAVDIEQSIRHTAHFDGKIHNIRLAVNRLNHIYLRPGASLSFWRLVGTPTTKNGFQIGRAIIDDRLSADVGGGLCQIASLLYELGLRSGVEILERHPHSRDLYTEESRFTPLGLDATVVWGFKDVRLRNPYSYPLTFAFEVTGATLRGRLFSEQPTVIRDLDITREDNPNGRSRTAVVCRRDDMGRNVQLSHDTYVVDPS